MAARVGQGGVPVGRPLRFKRRRCGAEVRRPRPLGGPRRSSPDRSRRGRPDDPGCPREREARRRSPSSAVRSRRRSAPGRSPAGRCRSWGEPGRVSERAGREPRRFAASISLARTRRSHRRNHPELPVRPEDAVRPLVALGERLPARSRDLEVLTGLRRVPCEAADRLGGLVDEAPRSVEERAVEALARFAVLEPLEARLEAAEDGRQLRAELRDAPEGLGDRAGLERRDPHLVPRFGAALVRSPPLLVIAGRLEHREFSEERRPRLVERPKRRRFAVAAGFTLVLQVLLAHGVRAFRRSFARREARILYFFDPSGDGERAGNMQQSSRWTSILQWVDERRVWVISVANSVVIVSTIVFVAHATSPIRDAHRPRGVGSPDGADASARSGPGSSRDTSRAGGDASPGSRRELDRRSRHSSSDHRPTPTARHAHARPDPPRGALTANEFVARATRPGLRPGDRLDFDAVTLCHGRGSPQ